MTGDKTEAEFLWSVERYVMCYAKVYRMQLLQEPGVNSGNQMVKIHTQV